MIVPEVLIEAYATGWFPMAADRTPEAPIQWFSPNPRGILPLDAAHFSARLLRTVRQERFTVTVDRAFDRVMRECAAERDESWINDVILDSYGNLHRMGLAHSVECWADDRLVGGLYGIGLRGAFFGESMFHRVTDASKVALHALVERLRARGFTLLDIQWVTPHLATFGAVAIPRRRYLRLLAEAMERDCAFGD